MQLASDTFPIVVAVISNAISLERERILDEQILEAVAEASDTGD